MSNHPRGLSYYEDFPDTEGDITPVIGGIPEVITTTPPYISRTLHGPSDRYRILPGFPSSFHHYQPTLLLANVPRHRLSHEQLLCRKSGFYPLAYSINLDTLDIESDFRDHHQAFISSLIYKYNADEPIFDYNLARFKSCYNLFIDDYCYHHNCSPQDLELTTKQKNYAFEFYLQIDVDLFFMKTCSFRTAKPRSADEGLFCIDEPDARYGLLPCKNCELCIAPNETNQQRISVRFGPIQKFRFMNGYETILNCPADCQTRNLLYVMTCPCNNAEYIGETSQRLEDRLWYHRQHFNRIVHEFLIGEQNAQLGRVQNKGREAQRKDRMRLYRHAARCPSAMQLFLRYNPIYWCFIPISINEAMNHIRHYTPPWSLVLYDNVYPTSIGSRNRQDISETLLTRSDEAVRSCMRALPALPHDYTFSTRQRFAQFLYFKEKQDFYYKSNVSLDLFTTTMIAVLPVDTVDIVRKFIEALFITHTETTLNIAGRFLSCQHPQDDIIDPTKTDQISIEEQIEDRGDWCRNIVLQYH